MRTLTLSGPLVDPKTPNERLGAWERADPLRASAPVRLSNPAGWMTVTPLTLPLPARAPYIASAPAKDYELTQVSFTQRELDSLTPGEVLENPAIGPRSTSSDALQKAACSR